MKRVIQFTKLRFLMIILSLLLIIGGAMGYFVRGGFNLGIDFTAGLTEQIQITPGTAEASIDQVRSSLADLGDFDLQVVGNPENQEFIVKVRAPSDDKSFQERMERQIFTLLADAFDAENVQVKQSDFIGPRYSKDLAVQTVSIVLVALVLILLYTAFRFKFTFAVAAVICLIHDVLVMMGVLAVFQLEVTTTTVAAILTIIGYSLNDTIVIFDRIRENQSLLRDAEFGLIVNTSITQSLSRTLLTSLTTLFAVVAIYIFATSSIRDFGLNLIIGVVVGTYSTIFIASPIVLGWQRSIDKRRKRRDVQRYGRGTPSLPHAAAAASGAPAAKPAEAAPVGGPAEEESEVRTRVAVTRTQPSRHKPSGKKKKKKKK
jgi:preprotein translocase subunit SecF